MSTIHAVDPIALRQKLKKLGIGPGLPMSQTFAEDAVRDCLNRHAGQVEVIVSDDIEVPSDAVEDHISVENFGRTMVPEVGTLVLEPAELAYCLHNWALLWEVPAA